MLIGSGCSLQSTEAVAASQLKEAWWLKSLTSKSAKVCLRRQSVVVCRPTKAATTDPSRVVIEKKKTRVTVVNEMMVEEMMIETTEALQMLIHLEFLQPYQDTHMQCPPFLTACQCSLLDLSFRHRINTLHLQAISVKGF
jgi:hypothetical protein